MLPKFPAMQDVYNQCPMIYSSMAVDLLFLYVIKGVICEWFPLGLVVRISGSHPGGPGSIPGMGIF